MPQLFRIDLRNPCSNGVTVPTRQKSVPQSSAWAEPRTRALAFWRQSLNADGDGHAPGVTAAPTPINFPDNWRLPRFCSIASVLLAKVPAPAAHRPGLAGWPPAPELPELSLAYPPKYAVFGHLFSCLRRIPVAPFFRRAHTLAVQNRRTGFLRMTRYAPHLLSQGVMNAFPGPVSSPIPKVGINRFPRRKVMRQHRPLTARSQHVKDGIHYLTPPMFRRPTPQFDLGYKWFKNPPFLITEITWVGSPLFHPAILPPFKKSS